MTENEAGGDAERRAELRRVGVGRLPLRAKRLPQAVDRALGDLAGDLGDLPRPSGRVPRAGVAQSIYGCVIVPQA